MRVLRDNPIFRFLMLSSAFNQFGAGIYNIVFVIYASTLPHANQMIVLADLIMILPIVMAVWTGSLADGTMHKSRMMIRLAICQAGLFLLAMPLLTVRLFWSFLLLCLINLVSDLMSEYASSLKLPLYKRHIEEADLPVVFGLNRFIAGSLTIFSQAFGVWLLAVCGNRYEWVALINAFLFLTSGLILLFKHRDLSVKDGAVSTPKFVWREQFRIKRQVNQLITLLGDAEMASVPRFILAMIVMNFAYSSIIMVLTLSLLTHKALPFDYGINVMVIDVSFLSGGMISGLLMTDFTQKWTLPQLGCISAVLACVVTFGNALYMTGWVTVVCLFCQSYISTKLNAKFSTLLIKQLPEDKLGTISAQIGSVTMLMIPIGIALFTGLSAVVSSQFSFLIMGLCVLFVLYLYVGILRPTS